MYYSKNNGYMRYLRIFVLIFGLLALGLIILATAASTDRSEAAKDTVVAYFEALSQGSNVNLLYWGTTGSGKDGYKKAYQYLSPRFKEKVSFEGFYSSYRGTATIELVQIYRGDNPADNRDSDKQFFVEIKAIEEIQVKR